MCTPFPDFRARAVPDPASCCFSSPPLRRCRAWFRIPRFVTVQRLRKTERWPSGRRRTPGKCVYGNPVSRVRIPPSPPDSSKGARLAPFAFPAPGVSGFEPSIDQGDGSTGAVQRHLLHLRPRGSCLSVGGWVLVRPPVFTVPSVRRLPCCGWPRFVVGCLRCLRPTACRALTRQRAARYFLACPRKYPKKGTRIPPGNLAPGPSGRRR